jgi:hypothetical protein
MIQVKRCEMKISIFLLFFVVGWLFYQTFFDIIGRRKKNKVNKKIICFFHFFFFFFSIHPRDRYSEIYYIIKIYDNFINGLPKSIHWWKVVFVLVFFLFEWFYNEKTRSKKKGKINMLVSSSEDWMIFNFFFLNCLFFFFFLFCWVSLWGVSFYNTTQKINKIKIALIFWPKNLSVISKAW